LSNLICKKFVNLDEMGMEIGFWVENIILGVSTRESLTNEAC